MTDPNRTSEARCVWCDQTKAEHRDSGPMAKMPCGGLKRGFIAEIGSKLFSKTSVGDVPAPVESKCCKCSVVIMRSRPSDSWICDSCFEDLDNEGMPTGDAEEWCPNCGAHWPDRSVLVEEKATSEERAAVVKHLRDEADELSATGSETLDVVAQSLRARAGHIEKGEHLK